MLPGLYPSCFDALAAIFHKQRSIQTAAQPSAKKRERKVIVARHHSQPLCAEAAQDALIRCLESPRPCT